MKSLDAKQLIVMQQQLVAQTKEALRDILFRHLAILRTILLVTGAVVSLVIVANILFFKTSDIEVTEQQAVRLNTDVVDELELFIETRQTTYENPTPINPQIFGT